MKKRRRVNTYSRATRNTCLNLRISPMFFVLPGLLAELRPPARRNGLNGYRKTNRQEFVWNPFSNELSLGSKNN
jgi:hypothetical protein